jgi:hypothetical protein
MMNKTELLTEDDSDDGIYRRIGLLIENNRWAWATIGATFGLAGGMLSILLGALLWITVRFLATGYFGSVLNVVEIFFFALTLPLLTLGAYCLDLLERRTLLLRLQWQHLRPKQPHNN